MRCNLITNKDVKQPRTVLWLQQYVCHDYKTSQRRNGMGGVCHRHNTHRLYLTPKMDENEDVKKTAIHSVI